MTREPTVTGAATLAQGKFLQLKQLSWRDANGVDRKWETAERVDFAGAVLIIPLMVPSNRLLLIRQYRPPAGRQVLEFPAGLINPGESPEAAAVRELREETGYVSDIIESFPDSYTTPGMSNESVWLVRAVIDEERAENLHPQTCFDPSEMIESVLVPRDEAASFLRRESADGTAIDAKLAAYIIGLEAAR